jgi:hypothetical protein
LGEALPRIAQPVLANNLTARRIYRMKLLTDYVRFWHGADIAGTLINV